MKFKDFKEDLLKDPKFREAYYSDTNEELLEWFEEQGGQTHPICFRMMLKYKDEQWRSKIRSLIPQINGGGNARRMLESLLDNKTE